MAMGGNDAWGAAFSGGEDRADFTLLGTINVTRLHNYRDEVLSLPSGCWALTETSSVAGEIVGDGRFFRQHGLGYIASKECQRRTRYVKNLVHAPTYGGTAVVSSCYVRPDRFSFSQDVRNTTRLISTFLHVDGLQVLIIVLYLPPKRHDDRFVNQDRREVRESIFTQAVHRAFTWGGPAVIMGDFNGDFRDLSSWGDLNLMGWTEVGEVHCAKTGEQLPATYQEGIRHDFILLSPFMAARHSCSWVLRDHIFPQHFPLMATFSLRSHTGLRKDWKLARPLEPRQREYLRQCNGQEAFCRLVEDRFGSVDAFQDCSQYRQDSFHAISNLVEATWKSMLLDAEPSLRLKSSQMGRCKQPRIKRQPQMTSASMGRIGDYTMAGEDTSVHAKQVTRQCRRLQCVIRMLRKYGEQQLPAAQYSTLQQDQNCILAAKGFGTSYAEWAHRKNLLALSLPFFDLHGVQQHFEAVQTFAEEGAKRHTSAKHRAWKDLLSKSFAVSGGRVAFRHIKNSFIPEISHVQTKQELDWVPVRRREKGPP